MYLVVGSILVFGAFWLILSHRMCLGCDTGIVISVEDIAPGCGDVVTISFGDEDFATTEAPKNVFALNEMIDRRTYANLLGNKITKLYRHTYD